MRHAFLLIAGIFATPLAAQAPDSTHPGTPAKEFYTRVVEVPAKPDTIFVTDTIERPLASGADTAVSGDTTRITFWHQYVARFNDSVQVRVKAPANLPNQIWGPTGYFNETSSGPFTHDGGSASNKAAYLLDNIAEARARGVPFQPNLPCGGHSKENMGNCLRDSAGVAVFSRARFDSAMKAIAAPAVVAAVQKAHAEGLITGFNIMDEAWVSGGDDGAGNVVGNTWGPPGTISKARADSLCGFAKTLFPGVPMGMSGHLTVWEPTKPLKVCDFLTYQYSHRFGNLTTWRDAVLAQAAQSGYKVRFSLNVINGGTQDRDGTWDCASEGGRRGSRAPNCRMTPAQLLTVVKALAPHSHGGLMTWKYDGPDWATNAAYQTAIRDALAFVKTLPYKPVPVR
jgi:hypothetical protein